MSNAFDHLRFAQSFNMRDKRLPINHFHPNLFETSDFKMRRKYIVNLLTCIISSGMNKSDKGSWLAGKLIKCPSLTLVRGQRKSAKKASRRICKYKINMHVCFAKAKEKETDCFREM